MYKYYYILNLCLFLQSLGDGLRLLLKIGNLFGSIGHNSYPLDKEVAKPPMITQSNHILFLYEMGMFFSVLGQEYLFYTAGAVMGNRQQVTCGKETSTEDQFRQTYLKIPCLGRLYES